MGRKRSLPHTIGIIGGGPAGSFAALHIFNLTRGLKDAPEILIFEPRNFDQPGPGACNRCAGILSSRVTRGLQELGIDLPADIIQAELNSYALHMDHDAIPIQQPDPTRKIYSVYRGGGPRLHQGEPLGSLDGFLLTRACERGARHIPHRVRQVQRNERPVIHTAHREYTVDFLVLATGINSRAPLSPNFGYQMPETAVMAQDEILRPSSWPADRVNAYFDSQPGLKFGAIIPKDKYLNISLLGRELDSNAVEKFIHSQNLQERLDYDQRSSLCGCNPRIAVGPAHGYCGDRWVAVGDAAVSRLYKDGIGSAFYTARKAMQVAFTKGTTKKDFQNHYAPYCKQISRDNRYGKLLFKMWDLTLNTPWLLEQWTRALRSEMVHSTHKQAHVRIVWGMFTGDEPYRDLFLMGIQPRAILSFLFPSQ